MMAKPELVDAYKVLPPSKKIYFASDFHLGFPNHSESLQREKKIIQWLEHVSNDAAAIFLLGDLFEFWFEYSTVVPKGHVRFLGKLAELSDRGIPLHVFSGNHDLWMRDYLKKELGAVLHSGLVRLEIGNKSLLLGHGDGLGPGDYVFKALKQVFTNPLCKWLFRWLHPDIGVSIALGWSRRSGIKAMMTDAQFASKEDERLYQFCKKIAQKYPYDYFVFGHRHLPLKLDIGEKSTYFNLGEWITQCNYLAFDGNQAILKKFEA